VLLDVNMPEMDGFETTQWLHKNYPAHHAYWPCPCSAMKRPSSKCSGWAPKATCSKMRTLRELRDALDSLIDKNVYLSEYVSGKLVSGLHQEAEPRRRQPGSRADRKKNANSSAGSAPNLSYKDIAAKMYLSARVPLDDYRQSLFNKLKVHSRVGSGDVCD
jgi:DNA-binding NarL/FixJ family response regulator